MSSRALPIVFGLPSAPVRRARPPRVAIVTPDVAGPIRNGGIGTAYTALARALAGAGHEVTIAYTLGALTEDGAIAQWIDRYRADGIALVPITPSPGSPPVLGPGHAFDAYRWLAAQSFDLIHFPEWGGTGFCIAQAKRTGRAFADTLLCAGLHSPTLWHDLENGVSVSSLDQLARDYLERRSVEAADVVISPSRYLLEWIDDWDWRLPARVHVQPNVFTTDGIPAAAPHRSVDRIEEVVFFGRLEQRKGLGLFCDAIDLLIDRGRAVTVSFLGKSGTIAGVDGASYARDRAARWPGLVNIEVNASRDTALDYLRTRPALAVMPSVADNSPGTVLECLTIGVPFVATRTGGIPEMIAASDHDAALAGADPRSLADAIERVLTHGAGPIRAAHDPDEVRQQWIAWHEAQVPVAPAAAKMPTSPPPLVSVCLATFNRAEMLAQALDAIRAQDYAPIEVVLVDDGSDDPATIARLASLQPEFAAKGWQMLRTNRQFPGAARNAAAAASRGEYLLFMDDDNIARPDEVSALVRAAQHAGADIVTCAHDAFRGETPSAANIVHRWLPLGPALPLGWFVNCIGDTNMLIARRTFEAIGGFEAEPRAGVFEDWALLVKAIEHGASIEAVHDPLYFYRLGPHGYGQQSSIAQLWDRPQRSLTRTRAAEVRLALAFATGRLHATGADPVRQESRSPATSAPVRDRLRLRERAHQWLVNALADRAADHDHGPSLASEYDAAKRGLAAGPAPWRIRALHQIELTEDGEALRLRSAGHEPQTIVDVAASGRGPWLVRIEMTAPAPTDLQLFWKTPRLPVYCEEHSVRAPLAAGRNVCFIRIASPRLLGRLRFDPGAIAGEFILHAFEIRPAPR